MTSSPPETRASLIQRLPNPADVAAWDEVMSIYGPLVYRLARRKGLQPADADDLVQVGDVLQIEKVIGSISGQLFFYAKQEQLLFADA